MESKNGLVTLVYRNGISGQLKVETMQFDGEVLELTDPQQTILLDCRKASLRRRLLILKKPQASVVYFFDWRHRCIAVSDSNWPNLYLRELTYWALVLPISLSADLPQPSGLGSYAWDGINKGPAMVEYNFRGHPRYGKKRFKCLEKGYPMFALTNDLFDYVSEEEFYAVEEDRIALFVTAMAVHPSKHYQLMLQSSQEREIAILSKSPFSGAVSSLKIYRVGQVSADKDINSQREQVHFGYTWQGD
jgi:hypothetical protein